jgi:hypothetical protein
VSKRTFVGVDFGADPDEGVTMVFAVHTSTGVTIERYTIQRHRGELAEVIDLAEERAKRSRNSRCDL